MELHVQSKMVKFGKHRIIRTLEANSSAIVTLFIHDIRTVFLPGLLKGKMQSPQIELVYPGIHEWLF